MPTKSVEQMNDGGWYATGYLTWSFRDYWWWNQKLIVVHARREFEHLREKT